MICCICNQDLPEEAFYPSEYKHRRCGRCKVCHKATCHRKNNLHGQVIRVGGRLMIQQNGLGKIYWTGNMLSDLKRFFPNTNNIELAEILGVSRRTLSRKAKELGLVKSKEYLSRINTEKGVYAHIVKHKRNNNGNNNKRKCV